MLHPLPLLVLVQSRRVVEKLLENCHSLVLAGGLAELLLEHDRVPLHRDFDALVLAFRLETGGLAADVAKDEDAESVSQGLEVDEVGGEEVLGGLVLLQPLG